MIIDPFRFRPPDATIEYAGYTSVAFASSVSTSITIGTAAHGRRVLVLIGIKPGGTYQSLVSASLNGLPASILGQTEDTTYKFNVAMILAPIETGTTATLELTFSGGGSGGVYLASYAAYGLLSDTPVDMVNRVVRTTPGPDMLIMVKEGGVLLVGSTNHGGASSDFTISGVDRNFFKLIDGPTLDQYVYYLGGSNITEEDDADYNVSVQPTDGSSLILCRFLAASFR